MKKFNETIWWIERKSKESETKSEHKFVSSNTEYIQCRNKFIFLFWHSLSRVACLLSYHSTVCRLSKRLPLIIFMFAEIKKLYFGFNFDCNFSENIFFLEINLYKDALSFQYTWFEKAKNLSTDSRTHVHWKLLSNVSLRHFRSNLFDVSYP